MHNISIKSTYGDVKKQQGVVLIVSLVFLVALTAVAAALMQNTTTDIKMSGASEEKVIAVQEAISAVDEIIFNQISSGSTNEFTSALSTFPDPKLSKGKVIGTEMPILYDTEKYEPPTLGLANDTYGLKTDCPNAKSASSVQLFSCNVLKIQVKRKYGRHNTSHIEVNAGITQQVLR